MGSRVGEESGSVIAFVTCFYQDDPAFIGECTIQLLNKSAPNYQLLNLKSAPKSAPKYIISSKSAPNAYWQNA